MMWSFLTAAAVLSTFMVWSCEGTGHVVVTLQSYRNPSHKKEGNKCCDYSFFRCAACHAYFKLCVADSLIGPECNIGRGQTGVVGNKDNHVNLNIRKDFAFNYFRGNIKLLLFVWDKDRYTKDEFVEGLSKYITLPAVKPGVPSSNHYRKSLTLSGKYVTVTLDLEVYCDKNFYGDSCNVKCIPRDDSSGHYTCDNLGRKVCMSGWFGESCTQYCVPRDDPINGHFTCDSEGNKMCLKNWQGSSCKSCVQNWFGPRCVTYCVPRDSEEHGHYKCRPENGAKDCLPWWFGTECRAHCIPHDDDDSGHYACARDGSKTCKHGWHGENCTVFCVPQDDDERGHYTCDNDGSKVCLDGYRPPDCRDCLLGRYGANCSLTCSNATQQGYYDCTNDGAMLCKPWWYGPGCLQYCVPHDDSRHGHYTCDPRDGSKVCREGWEGPNCLDHK